MFSGIRSMIFGYSEQAHQSDATSSTAGSPNESSISSTSKSSIEKTPTATKTSIIIDATIEQTLNAATTKFTEQLLPQSASIEQLQSSSHHLLPSLNEQHEEDELRKNKQQLVSSALSAGQVNDNDNDDDDDDCFEADSWELLDLVEKPIDESNVSSSSSSSSSWISSNQQDDVNRAAGKSSGILKTKYANKTKFGSSKQQHQASASHKQLRQKLKVSFETPDLVKENQQKIERITPKEIIKANNSRGKNKKKRSVQVFGRKADELEQEQVLEVIGAESNNNNGASTEDNQTKEFTLELDDNDDWPDSVEVSSSTTSSPKNKVPVLLNYAAALTSKPKPLVENANKKKDVAMVAVAGSSNTQTCQNKVSVNLQSSGAVKRNRPVSTSSWSSSDEIEPLDVQGQDIARCSGASLKHSPKQPTQTVGLADDDDDIFDDNESMISSGFSDCDYGYGGINDYIMRPKKLNYKRRVGSSNSSSLLGAMSKRADNRANQTVTKSPASNIARTSENKAGGSAVEFKRLTARGASSSSSSSCKSTKAKREKTVSSSPPVKSASFLNDKDRSTSGAGRIKGQQPVATSHSGGPQLMGRPQKVSTSTASSSNSGNDSSDVAEMDESWYVTPPPCFTGTNKLGEEAGQPKAKEAARENALIEHPSIYIASTSKQQQAPKRAAILKKVPKRALVGGDESENKQLDERSVAPSSVSSTSAKKVEQAHQQHKVSAPLATEEQSSRVSKSIGGSEQARRPPTLVRPIEPERRPAWQLKRQRSRRRPLGNSLAANCESSGSSSTSSTQQTSLVADLGNFIGGGSAAAAAPGAHQNALSSAASFENCNSAAARRRMSKAQKRQNVCASKQAGARRRADRRLKMFATPNGCSVDRKVHTSFH